MYGIQWRHDGGALAFFGKFANVSPAKDKAALLRGEVVVSDDEPSLLVYDLDRARLRVAGKLNLTRDQEYFRDIRWVGPNLYIATATLATPQIPDVKYHLYFYDLAADRATRIDELPVAPQLEDSPEGTPFLIQRFSEGENQRFRVVADGKVSALTLGDGEATFGLFGWSRDGKSYYVHGKSAEEGATALQVQYDKGIVKIEKVDFSPQRDLFVTQPEKTPPFTKRRERTSLACWQLTLFGYAEIPETGNALKSLYTRYDLATSSDQSSDTFSLAPNYSAVIYVAQETFFLQRIAELTGKNKERGLARLRRNR